MSAHSHSRRRRFAPAALIAGVAGALAISMSMTGTLSGLVATITNNSNTAASGTIAVSETSGSATCNSYDATTSCSTINKYGGATMVPGAAQTVTVKFTNVGTSPVVSSQLTPATCGATSTGGPGSTTPGTPNTAASNLCSVMTVAVYSGTVAGGTPLYSGSAAGFSANVSLGTLAVGANQSYTFVTSLPSSAGAAVAGQQISQNLVWTFNQ